MTWFRTGSRVVVVSVLCVGTLPLGGPVGAAEDVRTETKLAGFSVEVQASPVLVLLDDPNLQIPRPTGSAVIEGDPNYTVARVSAGPTALGIASSLWPGNLFGTGLPQVAPGAPPYPLKAEARYPDKPYTAEGPDGGVVTRASAEGLDAAATAEGTPGSQPGQLAFGNAAGASKATVDEKDRAVGTAVSAVEDVEVLGGLIRIGNVSTRLETSADGTKAASTGKTTVTGLTVAEQPFTVDETGIHGPGGQGSALPPLDTPAELAQIGIRVSGIAQTSTRTANGIKRTAAGLVITIETAPLKAALSPVLSPVNQALGGIISNMPPEAQGHLYYMLKATPKITYVFGAASSGSSATLPISFSFPPPSFPSGPLGGVTGGGPVLGGGPVGGSTSAPGLDTGVPSVVGPTAPGPVLQAPSSDVASVTDAGSTGIEGGWVVAALAGSALVGWGLIRFLGLAGGALALGCRLGAPTSVPDLRSVTA